MKKIVVFAAAFLLLLVAASFAQGNKYQIITEKKGLLGMGGKTVMMLDKETGDSWLYQDDKWVLIPKVEVEVVVKDDATTVKARMEEEINALKIRHEDEIQALKAKYELEIRALTEQKKVENKTAARQAYRQLKPRVRKVAKKNAPAPTAQSVEEGEEGPPAWLSE